MAGDFGAAVATAARRGELVVQPRMGFSDPQAMRSGLWATKRARAQTVGTVTVDSYTRVGDLDTARSAIAGGASLNGYPIATIAPEVTRSILPEHFPVQVRHGSAAPRPIIAAMRRIGLTATEGGPVSYCLPYGRVPLAESTENWRRACTDLVESPAGDGGPHLETFGGCMLGQLCPPALLVSLSVLEAIFFRQQGLRSISLSLTQQTDPAQDRAALAALRTLAGEHLPDVRWHVVLYAYMGVYPKSPSGARRLLIDAARLAVDGGAARLIVKTEAEAHRIPTVAENVRALQLAAAAARAHRADDVQADDDLADDVLAEARALVEATLELHADVGRALLGAFARGYLDVPFCLHEDNPGRARAVLDDRQRLRWSDVGKMPLRRPAAALRPMTSDGLLTALRWIEQRYDHAEPEPGRRNLDQHLDASTRKDRDTDEQPVHR